MHELVVSACQQGPHREYVGVCRGWSLTPACHGLNVHADKTHAYVQIHTSIFLKVVDYVSVLACYSNGKQGGLDASLLTLKPHL